MRALVVERRVTHAALHGTSVRIGLLVGIAAVIAACLFAAFRLAATGLDPIRKAS